MKDLVTFRRASSIVKLISVFPPPICLFVQVNQCRLKQESKCLWNFMLVLSLNRMFVPKCTPVLYKTRVTSVAETHIRCAFRSGSQTASMGKTESLPGTFWAQVSVMDQQHFLAMATGMHLFWKCWLMGHGKTCALRAWSLKWSQSKVKSWDSAFDQVPKGWSALRSLTVHEFHGPWTWLADIYKEQIISIILSVSLGEMCPCVAGPAGSLCIICVLCWGLERAEWHACILLVIWHREELNWFRFSLMICFSLSWDISVSMHVFKSLPPSITKCSTN